jgi:hypothetical protein
MVEINLEKFDEDGISSPDGVCWIDGEPCIHREHYKNCAYDYKDEEGIKVCIRKHEYRQQNPVSQTDEDSDSVVKPKKIKSKKSTK